MGTMNFTQATIYYICLFIVIMAIAFLGIKVGMVLRKRKDEKASIEASIEAGIEAKKESDNKKEASSK